MNAKKIRFNPGRRTPEGALVDLTTPRCQVCGNRTGLDGLLSYFGAADCRRHELAGKLSLVA